MSAPQRLLQSRLTRPIITLLERCVSLMSALKYCKDERSAHLRGLVGGMISLRLVAVRCGCVGSSVQVRQHSQCPVVLSCNQSPWCCLAIRITTVYLIDQSERKSRNFRNFLLECL